MKIILSGGGTMGPVTPLIAVAEEFSDHELMWIGTRRGPEREIVEAAGIQFQAIASGKLRRYFDIRTLVDPFLILAGFVQSLVLILRSRPDVIVSAGGYVSVPVIWAGWVLGVPSVIHQQDVKPLLAVRLMAPFARKITVAFPETIERFHGSYHGTTMEVVGNPVRRFVQDVREHREHLRAEGLQHFRLSGEHPVVLIFGGGTGSRAFNEFIDAKLEDLMSVAQVIHVTGRKGGSLPAGRQGKAEEKGRKVGYWRTEFLKDDLPLAYAVADLVVSRAGMGAISELSAVGLPTILVPIPNSHQEANAKYLEDHQAAVVVREGSDFHRDLLNQIQTLLSNPVHRADLSKTIYNLLPTSARAKFADIIRSLKN